MKLKPLSFKTSLGVLLGFLSLVVFAEVYSEYKLYSISSIKSVKNKEIQFEARLDDYYQDRVLASEERKSIRLQYLPLNDENEALINSEWRVTRILNENEETEYDIKWFDTEEKKEVIDVNLELVGTSLVRIDKDDELIYEISLFVNEKKMALFQEVAPEKYKIIELVKLKKEQGYIEASTKKVIASSGPKKEIRGVRLKETDLVLSRGIGPVDMKDPKKSNRIFNGEAHVEGEAILKLDNISSLRARLIDDEAGLRFEIDIDFAQINNGGQFSAYDSVNDETISGVISNSGEEGYKIRIASGKMQGSVLDYVTYEEFQRLRDQQRDQELAQEEKRQEIEMRKSEVQEESSLKREEDSEKEAEQLDQGYAF